MEEDSTSTEIERNELVGVRDLRSRGQEALHLIEVEVLELREFLLVQNNNSGSGDLPEFHSQLDIVLKLFFHDGDIEWDDTCNERLGVGRRNCFRFELRRQVLQANDLTGIPIAALLTKDLLLGVFFVHFRVVRRTLMNSDSGNQVEDVWLGANVRNLGA